MAARARSWGQCIRGLGVSVVLVLVGCGQALPGEAGDEGEPVVTTREDAIRIPNSLTTQALVFNALTTNRTANELMGMNSLNELFFPPGHPYINTQLRDPNAQQLMSYLVSCALEEGQGLKWTNPLTNMQEVWYGSMGLCPAWLMTAPTQGCLERVSACLLARNNAFGRRVELSVRGEHPTDPTAYALEPVTSPSRYEPYCSTQVASFSACVASTPGVTRDCGWTVDAIGSCTPGSAVRLGAGGPAPDECTGPVLGSTSLGRLVLRVCEGTSGCDGSGARMLGQSEGSCSTTAPAVAFACPASGYFSVMKASYESSLAASGTVQVAAPANYRLSEAQTFAVREGAYYGTIFDPKSLGTEVYVEKDQVYIRDAVVQGSVYRKMFSCYDSGWTNGLALATYRVCALPGSGANCAARVAGACLDSAHPIFPNSMCATDDGPRVDGDGDYEKCRDPSGVQWKEPVTVFLHGACDVVSSNGKPDLCKRR
ncbi:hypothetical protein [Hyalangium versicolor]|uniref:hypothetical protein n=1 Tax=Hyalangium versicolor TaxID=2861190 RepID=UPI001CCB8FFC|nr:hypothetical protein [Hyalangium versicolor]